MTTQTNGKPLETVALPIPDRGVFITFEGTDGAGKSTQIKLAWQWLMDNGIGAIQTFEPGDTPMGAEIRKLIREHHPAPTTMLMLMLADRAHHVQHVIRPALDGKHVVLCDRYRDSTVAYQSGGSGLDEHYVLESSLIAEDDVRPSMTILLQFPDGPEKGLRRETDQLFPEKTEFFQRVWQKYEELASDYGARIVKINADRTIAEVFEDVQFWIWVALLESLPGNMVMPFPCPVPVTAERRDALELRWFLKGQQWRHSLWTELQQAA